MPSTLSNIDARESTFTHIGGHQTVNTNYNIGTLVTLNLDSAQLEQALRHQTLHSLGLNHTLPASNSGTIAIGREAVLPTSRDNAARLIIDIVRSLMVPDRSHQCRELKEDLIILQRTLDLAGLAMGAYQDTMLGQILSDTIGNVSERCLEVLEALHGVIQACQPSLVSTGINFLRGRFLATRCELDELAIWRGKLAECQRSVVGCLQVLDSDLWGELGSVMCSGRISPGDFNRFLQQQSRSLPYYIPVNKIIVVDHLGRNLPIPTVFCSTWQGFHNVISSLCRNSAGHRLIEQGDYKILCDNIVVNRSELPDSIVSAGMVEMSIVWRERDTDHDKKCPRCGHVNISSVMVRDWIEWEVYLTYTFEIRGE